MAVGDLYLARIVSHANDRVFLNVVAYKETTEDIGDDVCQALSSAIANSDWLSLRDHLAQDAVHGAVLVHKIQGAKQPSGATYYVDKTGLRVGGSVPGNIGIRVNQNGQHQGRSSRGAMIFGGFPETGLNLGEWSDLIVDELQVLVDALNNNDVTTTAPNSGTFTMGFLSRAPAVAGEPLVAWPGTFVKPDSMTVARAPVTIRSRQTDYQAMRSS